MQIKWVPIFNVPLHRRLELFAVGFGMVIAMMGGIISISLLALLMYFGNVFIRTLVVLYVAFLFYDRKTGDQGGRGNGCEWVRNWSMWKHYVNYYPISLVKTADLPADRNYLLAVFPHGVLCNGSFGNFCTNYSKFRSFFPGVRSKCTTLSFHMITPLHRELVLSYGMCSASANSLTTLLSQSNDPNDKSNRDGFTSNAAVLMVGGAQEAYYAYPDSYKCVLKNRKGFVRIAIKTGAPLVPVISFGETNIFDLVPNEPGSILRRLQDTCKRYTQVAPVIFNGRGIFQYSYGFLPRRHPITTVVGAPIPVTKNPNPSEGEVNEVHAVFCKQLTELFETHKEKYVENHQNVKLEIL